MERRLQAYSAIVSNIKRSHGLERMQPKPSSILHRPTLVQYISWRLSATKHTLERRMIPTQVRLSLIPYQLSDLL